MDVGGVCRGSGKKAKEGERRRKKIFGSFRELARVEFVTKDARHVQQHQTLLIRLLIR